jgi:hypothetical protein
MEWLEDHMKDVVGIGMWALVTFSTLAAVHYSYAQGAPRAEPVVCGDNDVWLTGDVGASVTSTRLRIPPSARHDGVTFCIHGVVVNAQEALINEREGRRVFTLNGHVTLSMPR